MFYYEVAPNKIVRNNVASFTYCYDEKINKGQIVLIEVGKKQMIGVVIKQTIKPEYKTKNIISKIEDTPLPTQLVDLSLWMSEYYATPLALVLQTILPRGIQKKRRLKSKESKITKRNRTNIVFNDEQQAAINTVANNSGTFLLHGITGSGKTEVYIEIVKQSIQNNKSAIVLVPEIALTPQLISEFSNHFNDILITHSKMTESDRHKIWLEALNSQEPRIIIGPRSAIFTPFSNIGAIIVDEAHEPSFKQEQSPKYSALRASTILGRYHNAKVIFGSATPSIIDRYLAEKSNNPIIKLTKSAKENTLLPSVTIVDMTKKNNFTNHRFISNQLFENISETLKNKKQILIFHNRRGSTNITLCKKCGWTSQCPNCFIPTSLHSDDHILMCHTCGYKTKVPTSCPSCKNTDIVHKGIGTKLIEFELNKLFPAANIARFDADNKGDEVLNERYDDLYSGKIDIIIGTQIIAKGLDLPNLRTVGVIQADTGLSLPDFNSNERAFQLLSQVVGRVGRNEHQTNVVVQSYQVNHSSVVNGLSQDYEKFYNEAINDRKKGLFPPFTHLLKITCTYKTESAAISNSKKLAAELKSKIHQDVQIFGPTPAFYERQHDTYRWQLLLKSPVREHLIKTIDFIPPKNWQFELDPTSLL